MVENEIQQHERDLFGGAMTMHIPEKYFDLSQIRQVPDHQEVFQDIEEAKQERNRGSHLCIELLALSNEISNEESSEYYFTSLAENNNASENSITNHHSYNSVEEVVSNLGEGIEKKIFCGTCTGWQKIRESEEIKILINLCVIRIKEVETDILITWTNTYQNNKEIDVSERKVAFLRMISTLHIADWTLFA